MFGPAKFSNFLRAMDFRLLRYSCDGYPGDDLLYHGLYCYRGKILRSKLTDSSELNPNRIGFELLDEDVN